MAAQLAEIEEHLIAGDGHTKTSEAGVVQRQSRAVEVLYEKRGPHRLFGVWLKALCPQAVEPVALRGEIEQVAIG